MKNLIKKLIVRLGCSARNTETFRELWCDLETINRLMQVNISTAFLHQQTFPRFKGIYAGRDIAVVATGPSLKNYKPIEGCINIGINHAFKRSELNFDYLMVLDWLAVKNVINEINEYRRGQCVKLYGITGEFRDDFNLVIPESEAIKAGALRFRTAGMPGVSSTAKFTYDISSQPLYCPRSTVFPAMQFALWTNPRRIYIVGCDCSSSGHFIDLSGRKTDMPIVPQNLIDAWKELKKFASIYYPDTEIVSVNPVGLKGIFKDWNQDEMPRFI